MVTTPQELRSPPTIDLPPDREYDSEADADLDEALVRAIDRAQAADDDYLAQVLCNELKAHYYGCRLDGGDDQ